MQRVRLRFRQPVNEAEQRCAQLLHAGVGEFHFRFRTADLDRAEVGGVCDRVGQQRCLADAGFASNHQHPAAPVPGVVEQVGERLLLATASDQGLATIAPAHTGHRRTTGFLIRPGRLSGLSAARSIGNGGQTLVADG